MKMKGQLEDAVKGMGFERCVILQPGMLLGHRCVGNDSIGFSICVVRQRALCTVHDASQVARRAGKMWAGRRRADEMLGRSPEGGGRTR
jgi:hypothetical protein